MHFDLNIRVAVCFSLIICEGTPNTQTACRKCKSIFMCFLKLYIISNKQFKTRLLIFLHIKILCICLFIDPCQITNLTRNLLTQASKFQKSAIRQIKSPPNLTKRILCEQSHLFSIFYSIFHPF